MTGRREVRWLEEQLPQLVARGVLSEESAAALRAHYAADQTRPSRAGLLTISILGPLFVGVGIVLLVGHNWSELGRAARAGLAFLPLVLASFVSWRVGPRARTVAREAAATFQTLAVAACLSLVTQTYHAWNGTETFVLTWMLLAAPLIYLFRSLVVGAIYLAGIQAWFGASRGNRPACY
ncbi:MAG: DUF2157 domain-containing protein [Candidatus Eisenbacteria bacterium]